MKFAQENGRTLYSLSQSGKMLGLPPYRNLRGNSPYPQSLRHCRVQADRIAPSADKIFAIIDPAYLFYPYTQLLNGKETSLLATIDSLYSCTYDSSPPYIVVDPVKLQPKDVLSGADVTISSSRGAWHFADFGITWFLITTTGVVFSFSDKFRDNYTETGTMWGNTIWGYNKSGFTTGCAHRGRLVLGGIAPGSTGAWGDYDTDQKFRNRLDYFLASMRDALGDAGYTWDVNGSPIFDGAHTPRRNFVTWSSIGGGDALYLLFPNLLTSGYWTVDSYDTAQPQFMEMVIRNEFGFMPMPWNGQVLCTKVLGKNIIVYGDAGIAVLYPVTEPFPTYGLQEVHGFGISGRGAVGGNEHVHAFIDTQGNLWRWEENKAPEKLGYKDFFDPTYVNPISDAGYSILYHEPEEEFYIGYKRYDTDAITYLLTNYGLSQSKDLVMGIYSYPYVGTLWIGEEGNDYFYYCSDPFTMDSNKIKRIKSITLDLQNQSSENSTDIQLGLTLTLYSRMQIKGDSGTTAVNWDAISTIIGMNAYNSGNSRSEVQAIGREFMFSLESDSDIGVVLKDIIIEWSYDEF